MNTVAHIEAEVTFLPESEGGRATPPVSLSADSRGSYRPHIVVGDPNQRQAILIGNEIQETYLAVAFVSGSEHVEFSKPYLVELAMIYNPHPAYESLFPGATFTIREGAKVVGYGQVKRLLP